MLSVMIIMMPVELSFHYLFINNNNLYFSLLWKLFCIYTIFTPRNNIKEWSNPLEKEVFIEYR